MTFKEARNTLSGVIFGCYRGDSKSTTHLMQNVALHKLLEAAGYRIKMKPIGDKEHGYKCPICKSDNIEVWQDGGFTSTRWEFCPDCGQGIDWGDA